MGQAKLAKAAVAAMLSVVLLGAVTLSAARSASATPSVNAWAIPTISFKFDGADQIIQLKSHLDTGNFVEKIRVTIDPTEGSEKVYEFHANGTIISADTGLISVDCDTSLALSGGYAVGPTDIKCTLVLDKGSFDASIHQIKVEVILATGTLTKTGIKFTLTNSTSKLSDIKNNSFAAPGTAERSREYNTVTVEKNIGAINAGGHWIKVYLSSDTAKDGDDTLVGEKYVTHLGKGSTKASSIKVTIPGSYPLGSEFFLSFADSENVIGEQDETNNIKTKATNITS